MATEEIKRIILEVAEKYGVKVDRIILFGSRARGDFRYDSDWDILIVSETKTDRNTERRFLYECVLRLLDLDVDAELVMVSRDYYNKRKNAFGNICGTATLEGVVL
ncbi:MAG: nucleotidyltransferase domain-containing protein [Candidatus Desulfofervidus auxilii]|nr:nucleotidyltransferase domain-containing protein [Candidatus Methanospirare jalkutatii]MDL1957395.1 nucleotidyltransferase domain-containing protein [Candidatus Desulfofervidus auxilii]